MPEKPPTTENKDKEPFNLEKWLSLDLPRQYEEKARMLNRLGLLEILPEKKEIGLVAIDGKEYPIPEQEEIERAIRENKELFEEKMKQGFTELEIVPFGLPLERLVKTAERTILKHHQEEKLFTARKNPADETEQLIPLELEKNQPIFVLEEYHNADLEGKLVYFPKEFTSNHQGQTKEQILKETGQGFQIILREENLNIPRQGKGETIPSAGSGQARQQLEANQTPNEYLKTIQSERQYQNEQGQTPEDWLTIFISHLEKHNQVIDDFQGNGSIAYNLGAFFTAVGVVPGAVWDRAGRQAYLSGVVPGARRGSFGVRARVRVF